MSLVVTGVRLLSREIPQFCVAKEAVFNVSQGSSFMKLFAVSTCVEICLKIFFVIIGDCPCNIEPEAPEPESRATMSQSPVCLLLESLLVVRRVYAFSVVRAKSDVEKFLSVNMPSLSSFIMSPCANYQSCHLQESYQANTSRII